MGKDQTSARLLLGDQRKIHQRELKKTRCSISRHTKTLRDFLEFSVHSTVDFFLGCLPFVAKPRNFCQNRFIGGPSHLTRDIVHSDVVLNVVMLLSFSTITATIVSVKEVPVPKTLRFHSF